MIEAKIVIGRCYKNGQAFAIRVEKRNKDWIRTWAYKINDKTIKSEGFGNEEISGSFNADKDYPGCPYCGTYAFFTCGKCGKINCWDGESKKVKCNWCGTECNIVKADVLKAKSGEF